MPRVEEPRTYLVEWLWPGIDERKHASAAERAQEVALQLRREDEEIEFLGSILVSADETVFCFFTGRKATRRKRAGRPALERAGSPPCPAGPPVIGAVFTPEIGHMPDV